MNCPDLECLQTESEPCTEISSSEKLARVLEEIGDPRLQVMIERARQDYYDDFKSQFKYPKSQLVAELVRLGLMKLIQRVVLGEFDATEEEKRAWFGAGRRRSTEGSSPWDLDTWRTAHETRKCAANSREID